MAGYDIRPYRPGDETGIVETFNAVFAEGQPGFEPRTLDEWRWAFEHNPAGRRVWVAEAADGTIAAQCAALPFRVRLEGADATITQGVDSMVHPDHRRGLRRPGLFVATAQPFFRQYGPQVDALHYGWPVEPAWRIGKTFLGYQIVRTQTVLFRTPPPGPTELPEGVERLSRFDDDVEALYDRCAADWGLSVVRDATYLNWRFVEHPRFRYRILGVRAADGALRAYAVFRKADTPRPESGLIMDWLVRPDDVEAGELLRDALLAQARADGAAHTIGVFPDWSPWFDRFQTWSWDVYGSDYLLIGIVQRPRHDTWWLRENWWYQLAELDAI